MLRVDTEEGFQEPSGPRSHRGAASADGTGGGEEMEAGKELRGNRRGEMEVAPEWLAKHLSEGARPRGREMDPYNRLLGPAVGRTV